MCSNPIPWWYYNFLLPAGLRVAQPCRYAGIVFTQRSKNGFFAPQGRHVAPINVKFGTGNGRQKCGNTAPKTVKISNFGQKFVPQGRLVCNIFTKFSAFVRVYRYFLSYFRGTNTQVISIFPRWGHFPTNFQWPLTAIILIASKKLGGCKNGTDLLYHLAKYGGDPGSRADCR